MKILCKQMPHERQEHDGGALELLILKSLASGPKHGYAIVEHLRVTSKDVLHVGESALYLALQRLLNSWAKAEWGVTHQDACSTIATQPARDFVPMRRMPRRRYASSTSCSTDVGIPESTS